MAVVTLLNARDAAFDFEHRKAHEAMQVAVPAGTSPAPAAPLYWLDPAFGDLGVPAGWENTLHTAAHADFQSLFPTSYGGSPVSLNDVSLEPEPNEWWVFSNHQLHYVANQAP